MAEHSRIDDLRRRVQKDPASIAFAQLAEECRRSGVYQEAVDTCRAGLAIHPGYLSARVTLGRALIELGELDEAQAELSRVLESAPENLAAIRGLAEINHTRGNLAQALTYYRAALVLARNDPDLEETIADLSRQVEPAGPAEAGGLSMEHMQDELLKLAPPKKGDGDHFAPAPPPPEPADTWEIGGQASAETTPVPFSQDPIFQDFRADTPIDAGVQETGSYELGSLEPEPHEPAVHAPESFEPEAPGPVSRETDDAAGGTLTAAPDDRATRTVAALEQWLAAIHVSREERHS